MKKSMQYIVMIVYLAIFALIYFSFMAHTEAKECSPVPLASEIVVEKSAKKMTLYDEMGCKLKEYKVRTGLNKGPKQCEGDKKTPEGIYHVIDKRDSKYVKFLELDYPRAKDIEQAYKRKCNPGSAIGIHYYNKEYTNDPSTLEGSLGCITVWKKSEIEEINKMVIVGVRVVIKP